MKLDPLDLLTVIGLGMAGYALYMMNPLLLLFGAGIVIFGIGLLAGRSKK